MGLTFELNIPILVAVVISLDLQMENMNCCYLFNLDSFFFFNLPVMFSYWLS